MPVRPKKKIQERLDFTITGEELENLILGFSLLDGTNPFETDDDRRKCWRQNRNYILSLQGKPVQQEAMGLSNGVYFDFFKRPEAWWRYDSPGPRLYLSCKNGFCPHYPACPVVEEISSMAPECVLKDGHYQVFDLDCVSHGFKIDEPQRETEREFLERNDLLTQEEKNLKGGE